jgi:hypothetical protein
MYSLPRGPPDRCRRAPPTFGCPAGKLDIGISCVFSSGQRVQFAVSAAGPRREPAASGRQPAALTGHLQTGHLEVLDWRCVCSESGEALRSPKCARCVPLATEVRVPCSRAGEGMGEGEGRVAVPMFSVAPCWLPRERGGGEVSLQAFCGGTQSIGVSCYQAYASRRYRYRMCCSYADVSA